MGQACKACHETSQRLDLCQRGFFFMRLPVGEFNTASRFRLRLDQAFLPYSSVRSPMKPIIFFSLICAASALAVIIYIGSIFAKTAIAPVASLNASSPFAVNGSTTTPHSSSVNAIFFVSGSNAKTDDNTDHVHVVRPCESKAASSNTTISGMPATYAVRKC